MGIEQPLSRSHRLLQFFFSYYYLIFSVEKSHLNSRLEEDIVDIGEKLKASFKNDYSILFFYFSRQMAASPFAHGQEQ